MAALRLWVGVGALAMFAAAPPAWGDDALRSGTSLRLIPADAAFFRTCLRNREQFDAVMQSEAMRRVLEAPRVARLLAALRERRDSDAGLLQAWLDRPENRELADFAVDALSQEVFWYGDASFADVVDLSAHVNQSAAAAQLAALREGRSVEESERAAANVALQILAENPQGLRVPTTVIGFRVTDPDRARRQIVRLEEMLHDLLEERESLRERLSRERIAGAEFLTWRLDGSFLPWELIAEGNARAGDPRLRERLKQVLKTKQATISIGLVGEYLIVSLGEGNQHLAHIGRGPLLIDRPEMAPLRQATDQRVNSIVYVSEAYRKHSAMANQHQFFGSFLIEELMKHPEAQGEHLGVVLDEQSRAELVADLKLLAKEVSAPAESMGASLRFSFLTPRGYEGYWYDWSAPGRLDGSQPLTVLRHVGDHPIGFLALRRTVTGEDYDRAVEGLRRSRKHFEKIVVPNWSEEQQQTYAAIRAKMDPLWAELDRANRELLIPALEDGQTAFVLSDLEAEGAAPEADGPPDRFLARLVPQRLALAVVCGVSDAEQFEEGCRTWFAVVREVWGGVRNLVHDVREEVQARTGARAINALELPTDDELLPEKRELEQGTLYFYSLSDRLLPNLALSNDFLVMSMRPALSLRLLEDRPFQDDGPLSETDRLAAMAAYLDFPRLVDAIQPRLEAAVDRARERRAERGRERPEVPSDDKPALRLMLDVLRCFGGFACVTYAEGDATVTHYELRFQDMPPPAPSAAAPAPGDPENR